MIGKDVAGIGSPWIPWSNRRLYLKQILGIIPHYKH
jgi:hypothetical protein